MNPLANCELRQLDETGYLALPGLVTPRQTAAMKSRLEQLLESAPQDHAGTLIVGGLLDEAVFDAAWNHRRVLAAVEAVLGRSYLLSGVSSRGLRPGHGQQALHCDWGGQGEPGVWYLCHAICALVDFTAGNGATRVIPGSHRNPRVIKSIRNPRLPHSDEVQLTGEAGTIFILNVHCLHSAVDNHSPQPRLALFSSFSRSDSLLLALNPHVPPSDQTLARFDGDARRILTGRDE